MLVHPFHLEQKHHLLIICLFFLIQTTCSNGQQSAQWDSMGACKNRAPFASTCRLSHPISDFQRMSSSSLQIHLVKKLSADHLPSFAPLEASWQSGKLYAVPQSLPKALRVKRGGSSSSPSSCPSGHRAYKDAPNR